LVSDPTRTILDFLIDPKLGGGIRMTADMLKEYLKSEHKNLTLLIDYANRLNNSAAFKRLGFLLEQYAPEELDIIGACKKQVTISKTKLDPQLDSDKLITRFRCSKKIICKCFSTHKTKSRYVKAFNSVSATVGSNPRGFPFIW
jgi:predicted transcriptional regulator of viral defense system